MKILVGLSGGVDSAASALLLMRQGHDVEGATLLMHGYTDVDSAECVARELGIRLNVIDCRDDFDNIIKENFVSEYSAARTPNPCILCNERVKFKRLLEYAEENGFDRIATGHYAKIVRIGDRYTFSIAADVNKDQSYMLYRLPQCVLEKLVLPLSDVESKDTVRDLLRERGITLANKPDSQEICFLPNGGYAEFIENKLGVFPEGDFIDTEGNILGKHKGIIRYTVGQRKGLGIALGERVFVTAIDPIANTVTLSPSYPGVKSIALSSPVYSGIMPPTDVLTLSAFCKVRYKAVPVPATLNVSEGGLVTVDFDSPVRAAKGQSAVLYDEQGRVLIGGFIS